MIADEVTRDDPLAAVIDVLQATTALDSGFADRLHARIGRQQRLRHAGMGLALCALLALGIGMPRTLPARSPITFNVLGPGAASVAVVGDFTEWRRDRVHLTRVAGGSWRVTLRLPPGQYRFAYLLDDHEWRADAGASQAPDDFGRPTSLLTVPAP
jgi:1,4-alpha-glucan branching enzyme